ncbi:MAG: PhzF family phenazine biosynthesis protein [Steroidobacteraceae bacterium]
MKYPFRLLNVFALESDRFSGNPLCVFEDARGLTDEQMQALALQFNLSETTFILPSDTATSHVRIFTPSFEMPFAGHPTLGTAHVVRDLRDAGDEITLQMQAGIIPVLAHGDTWTLRANAPKARAPEASREQFASMLGLKTEDIGAQPLWVNTGSEQLIIPLTSVAAVARTKPDVRLMARYGSMSDERCLAYVWADCGDGVLARFFFGRGTAIAEDPATGSAAANLGGWYLATGCSTALERVIWQGEYINRSSQLQLRVDAGRNIFVAGRVLEVGRGVVEI